MRVLWMVFLMLFSVTAAAHDKDRPELNGWFDTLKSGKGMCCSFTDGTSLADVDWDTQDKHYRVRIDGKWWDVPDDAVIDVPNRDGRTWVWPIRHNAIGGEVSFEIRCFMPGMMT